VALCNELFPVERAGVVYGWVFAAHQLGAAMAAYAAGAIHGATGSYQLAFHLAGLLCIVAAGLVQLIRHQPSPQLPAQLPGPGPLPALAGATTGTGISPGQGDEVAASQWMSQTPRGDRRANSV
jgi:MFS family permease